MRILTLSQLSLAGSSGIAEVKQPIWFADGQSSATTTTTAGQYFIADGQGAQNTAGNPNNYTQVKLFTLSSSYPASQKFAFEATLFDNTSGGTAYAELWDITTNTAVSGSQVSTTSTTATVIRSGQFTLIPSHVYGVTIWYATNAMSFCDASLIIFPS